MAEGFLCEVYSIRQAADGISQRYFDGRQVPFPAVAEEFARLTGCMEEMVEGYNEDFANETGQAPESLSETSSPNLIDTVALEKAVVPAARQHAAFLVDMARAEVLDSMGENQKALDLIDRHV